MDTATETTDRRATAGLIVRATKPRQLPADNVGKPFANIHKWRHLVGQHGPKHPTTRLVLFSIGSFIHVMNGEPAFPSVDRIAEYACLGKRCVQEHIDLAVRAGWLVRQFRKGCSNHYYAALPESFDPDAAAL